MDTIDKETESPLDKEIGSLLLRAQALHEVGRLKESLALLHRVAALWPESSDLYVDIADVYVDLGDNARALEYTSKALRLKPEYGAAFYVRARALFRQNKFDETIEAATLALRYEPDSPATYALLSDALRCKGKHREAQEIASRLLEQFPEDISGHVMMSAIAGTQKKWADAETHSRAILKIDPTNLMGLNNLGLSLCAQGKKEESLDVFLRLARLRPDYKNNAVNLSNFSRSDLPVAKFDSLPPEVRKLISKNPKRRGRWKLSRYLFMAVSILPGPLYVLGALLLPAATFSILTLLLVLWTALVSSSAILGLKTPGLWKFQIVVAPIGLAIWSLFHFTNISGDAWNYDSTVILISLIVLLLVNSTCKCNFELSQ